VRTAALGVALALAAAAAGCSSGGSTHRDTKRGGAAAPVAGPAPATRAITRALDSVHQRYRHEILGGCFGAILGDAHAVRCYGRLGRDSSGRPTPQTLFQIGSITKTFTATLLALRVHQGAVRLSDPIRRYIPAVAGSALLPRSMTLLDMADHYSGLPRSTPLANALALHNVDEYFAAGARCVATPGCPTGPPGGQYLYSNFAYGILGQALGRGDGYSFSSYSAWEKDNEASITRPLGMSSTHSGFRWRALAPRRFDALRAHATMDGARHEPTPLFFPPGPYADPAGGLYSDSIDMLTWLSFSMGLAGTPALNAARRLLYDTPSLTRPRDDPSDPTRRIGLGWRIDITGSRAARTTCVYKNGESRGFAAQIAFLEGHRLGAFVMLNTVPQNPVIADIMARLINSLGSTAPARREGVRRGGAPYLCPGA
jgi:serine-type D-Ala-D-Ala carboxypeptidase/endopeptidase